MSKAVMQAPPAATSALVPEDRARYTWRKAVSAFTVVVLVLLALSGVGILGTIVVNLFINGLSSINLDLLVKQSLQGGILNALIGTLLMVGMAALMAVPIGVLTAIYLSEYGYGSRFAEVVRFCLDLLAQMPTIVTGLFIWLFVVQYRLLQPIGFTGSLALAIVMLPIIARTVEEVLRLVPGMLREAALALGVPRWRMVISVVIPTVLPGIVTGVLLGVARAAGETAPIILVAGNDFINWNLFENPMGAIPLQIYKDSTTANFPRAFAAALVLISTIAMFSAAARFFTRKSQVEY
ncbi:MAG: phosphate ABC transporter permease PstA [Phototrophicaceae bacterium]|jgi:phosphate transport system permease protein